jgi:transposase InsO family protein
VQAIDITYLPTGEGWLYLAVLLDAYSRRVVGWAMADHLRTELALDALAMALRSRLSWLFFYPGETCALCLWSNPPLIRA